jgi:hypothetical protein
MLSCAVIEIIVAVHEHFTIPKYAELEWSLYEETKTSLLASQELAVASAS